MSKVRVRFAPSPTGALHIGGVRTALFNYLFSRKHQGDFVLRIEDTDQSRFVEGAEQYIMDSLNWLGMTPDESPAIEKEFGPYRQSERLDLYKNHIPALLKSGFAYYAFDTTEELDQKRKSALAEGKVFTYNAETRGEMHNSIGLSEEELKEKLMTHSNFVIRFKMPENGEVIVNDLIRGTSKVNTQDLDDKILVKADGFPTYHLANVIDDHLMQISHVIRGEEWLPSLPLHILLYRAFEWEAPEFAHLPLILKPNGQGKLSKRDGAKLGIPVYPMEWKEEETTHLGFKELGYSPEALLNFLAGLGWTPQPENEVLSMDQLIAQFELEKVHKAGARFDVQKAEHIKNEVFQSLSINEILPEFIETLHEWNVHDMKVDSKKVISVMQERASSVNELISESMFFYEMPLAYNQEVLKKATSEETPDILSGLRKELANTDWEEDYISQAMKDFSKTKSVGMGKVMMPVRLALVGEMKGPDVPVIMGILGKEESLRRLEYLEKALQV